MLLSIQFTAPPSESGRINDSPISCLQGPEISNVIHTPNLPEWYDNITINAQVTDPWGIFEVWLNYEADNDKYAGWVANFSMVHVSDDLYTYTIQNSEWDLPWGPADGSYVNYTIFAINGLGNWSQSGYFQFYINDTIAPVAQILTLTNNSYVSGAIQINTTIIEEGSGIKQANLSMYMGNSTLLETFSTTNVNETFLWDVSSLPDYNISEPASYYTINFTVWDKATPTNMDIVTLESIKIDNTAPFIAFINAFKNTTAFILDNQTFTNNIISAANFTGNINSTHYDNSTYHSFYNGSDGFLQVAYGFNLSAWNLTVDMLDTLSITLNGKVGYTNSSIVDAGWKIWNWVHQNFTIIDATVFNSTTDVTDVLSLTSLNKSLYISNESNYRIEIFFFVNTTGPEIAASIDFILFNISYFEIDEWYNPDNENITLRIVGDDLISFDRIELFNQNITYSIINSSGLHIFDFNTTVLPSGLVPLNITVYDQAGNTNSSSILLNIDFVGPTLDLIFPVVNLSSPVNDTYIGQSGIWNLIIPVEFTSSDENFEKLELWIDGSLAPVLPGQLGQILEYDEFGNVTYEQTNATWYEEGNFKYYWNTSTLIHGTIHELQFICSDNFGNPSEYKYFITVANFHTNISITDVIINYSTLSDTSTILEFIISNHGNSTLKDFTPQIILPSNWDWHFKDVDSFDFQYLSPGANLNFKIEIIPRSVQYLINQTIQVIINCTIIENLTQVSNQFYIQIQTYLIVEPQSSWPGMSSAIFILLSIALGLGIGLLAFKIYLYLKEVSSQPAKPPEKVRKRK